jgi:alkylation response protein AidB-like acyl-CoA dehydrogenase
MDAADLELFERSLRHATEQHAGVELDAALIELGWLDALGADPRTAVSVLFELAGAANATSGALDQVVLASLRDDDGVGSVVLSTPGRSTPPGEITNGAMTVRGVGSAALMGADSTLVVASENEHHLAVTVPTDALTLASIRGLDPRLGLVEVTGDDVPLDGVRTIETWDRAVAIGRIALGHELVGASRTMLTMACTHALERVQFDRPISSFQAVRHRLADTLVAIETADVALGAAWDDPSPPSASMAKALAGRGARTAARHCQQVLAGIGFTTEHDLHHYIRRALVLDELFGSARTLTRDLGDNILATRRLPAPVPL